MRGIFVLIITATELKQNLGKYLELAQKEDVLVKKNDKIIVKLVSSNNNSLDEFLSLKGALKDDKIQINSSIGGRFGK